MQKISATYTTFEYTLYPASLQGDDRYIHQQLTQTNCYYSNFTCIPVESPLTQIIWPNVTHRFSLYHKLGVYPIKRIRDFVLIPQLGIGGSILYRTFSTLLLDTGYKIYIRKTRNSTPRFDTMAYGYLKKAHMNVRADLTEGKFVQDMIHNTETLLHLAHTTCNTNKEIRQLQRWLLSSFPDVAGEYLFPDLGKIVEPVGDALLIHKCQPVSHYYIFWNQMINDTCYATYPVSLPNSDSFMFLDLAKRRLNSHAHPIPCPPRTKSTFITDKTGTLWRLHPDNNFTKTSHLLHHRLNAHVPLPKLAHFSLKLLHHDPKPPSRIPLLQLLARSKANLDDLATLRQQGAGDIIKGIGKVLGSTLSSIAKGGSIIIRSLGKGIHDTLEGVSDLDTHVVQSITNATTSVIDSTTSGLSKIISSLGGLGNIILWTLVIVIYLFLFSQNFPFSKFRRPRQTLQPVPPTPFPSIQDTLVSAEIPPILPPRCPIDPIPHRRRRVRRTSTHTNLSSSAPVPPSSTLV